MNQTCTRRQCKLVTTDQPHSTTSSGYKVLRGAVMCARVLNSVLLDHAEQVERLEIDEVDDRNGEHTADGGERYRDDDQDSVFQRAEQPGHDQDQQADRGEKIRAQRADSSFEVLHAAGVLDRTVGRHQLPNLRLSRGLQLVNQCLQ